LGAAEKVDRLVVLVGDVAELNLLSVGDNGKETRPQRTRAALSHQTEMASASAEQSTGGDQVNGAITQMDHVTQSNSAQTEELSSTAQGLAGQAAHLLELVDPAANLYTLCPILKK
jgi:methyl-accepting chemotaxis protein